MDNQNLPLLLKLIKDEFDEMNNNSNCKCTPDYDLEKYLVELFGDKLNPDEILIIQCPHCGHFSYYNGGFTASCSCCGFYNLADYSDYAITLIDYWYYSNEENPYD